MRKKADGPHLSGGVHLTMHRALRITMMLASRHPHE